MGFFLGILDGNIVVVSESKNKKYLTFCSPFCPPEKMRLKQKNKIIWLKINFNLVIFL